MIQNLSEYFLPEQEYYLDSISYKRFEPSPDDKESSLKCTDTLSVEVTDDTVIVTLSRSLNFDPDKLFSLSVSFGAILKYNPDKKDEINWNDVNLAQEFRVNGRFALSNLSSRISLLIGQITSSYGQPPLILPAGIVQPDNT